MCAATRRRSSSRARPRSRNRRPCRASPGRCGASTRHIAGSRHTATVPRTGSRGRSAPGSSSSSRRRSPTAGSRSRTTRVSRSRSTRRRARRSGGTCRVAAPRRAPRSPASSSSRRSSTRRRAIRAGLPMCSTGEVIAFDALTGKVRWRAAVGPTESSPLVHQGRVYVGDWRGRVIALDQRTGRIVWTFRTGGRVKGAVAALGNRVFAGSYDGRLYALDCVQARSSGGRPRRQRLGGLGRFYSDPGGCVRPGLHRLDGRQGLRVRGDNRRSALVALDGRLRLLVAGRLGESRLVRFLLRRALRDRCRDRSDPLELSGRSPHLGCPDGDERPRLLRDPRAATRTRWTVTPASRCGRSTTASTRRSSPTASASTSSAGPGSTASPQTRFSTVSRCDISSPARPASSARTSPRRCRARATTWSASTPSPTTTTRAEGGERGGPRRRRGRSRLRDDARLDGYRRRLPSRGPAGRARASATSSSIYLRRNVLAIAASVRGGGARRHPRRLRLVVVVYGDAEAYPTPEDAVPRPISPYGVTKLALRASRHAHTRGGLRPRRRRAPLLQRVRAAPAAGHGVHAHAAMALAEGPAVRPLRRRRSSRGASRTSTTPSAATIARDGAAASGRSYNIGGGEEATMREAISLAGGDRRQALRLESRDDAAVPAT